MSLLLAALFAVSEPMALEIDVPAMEQKIATDSADVSSRLLLAKHYVNFGEIDKAAELAAEALQIAPKDEAAIKMQQTIEHIRQDREVLAIYKFSKPASTPEKIHTTLKQLNRKQRYDECKRLYETLERNDFELSDKSRLLVAQIYFAEEQLQKSEKESEKSKNKPRKSSVVLSKIKNRQGRQYQELEANICFEDKNYNCAIKIFQSLFSDTKQASYGTKLIELYIHGKQIDRAEKQLLRLKRLKRLKLKQTVIQGYEAEIARLKREQLEAFRAAYEKTPNIANMKNLVGALLDDLKQDEALEVAREFLRKNPDDKDAKLFLATRLSWLGKNDEALEILYELDDGKNFEVKLQIAKILSWSGRYEEAKAHIDETLKNSDDEETKLEHIKVLAFIYSWSGEKEKAIDHFSRYLEKRPNDVDAKEELMILQGNVKPLIIKYRDLVEQFPDSEKYLYRLGSLYLIAGNSRNAIRYLEKYLELKPQDLLVNREIANLYIKQKNYHKGFGYLEYYAYKTGTSDALLELAKNYHWAGFISAALDVIDEIFALDKENAEAIELKALIQKQNPRFTLLPGGINSPAANSIAPKLVAASNISSADQLAMADQLATAGFFASSLPYYQAYLLHKLNDHAVRSRYAYALQMGQQFEMAAGEYYLLLTQPPKEQHHFHYAYNLELAGKREQAIEEYHKLLDILKNSPTEEQQKWLKEWQQAWQSGDFERYRSFYSVAVQAQPEWIDRELKFIKAGEIKLELVEPTLIAANENGYRLRFYERYQSRLGKTEAYKELTVHCEERGCLILREESFDDKYQPQVINSNLRNQVRERLQALENNAEIGATPLLESPTPSDVTQIVPAANLLLEGPPEPPTLDAEDADKVGEIMLDSEPLLPAELLPEPVVIAPATEATPESAPTAKTESVEAEISAPVAAATAPIEEAPPNRYQIGSNSLIYNDSNNAHYESHTLLAQRFDINGYDLKLAAGSFKVEGVTGLSGSGEQLQISAERSGFELGLHSDRHDNRTVAYPYLRYQGRHNGYSYALTLDRRNAVHRRYTECVLRNGIELTRLEGTLYKGLAKQRSYWGSLELAEYNDNNQAATHQFSYAFTHFGNDRFSTEAALSGWYQSNSLISNCYYSPARDDATFIDLISSLQLPAALSLKAKLGTGYSFNSHSASDHYGLWLERKVKSGFTFNAGCSLSNSTRITTQQRYQYDECSLQLNMSW